MYTVSKTGASEVYWKRRELILTYTASGRGVRRVGVCIGVPAKRGQTQDTTRGHSKAGGNTERGGKVEGKADGWVRREVKRVPALRSRVTIPET